MNPASDMIEEKARGAVNSAEATVREPEQKEPAKSKPEEKDKDTPRTVHQSWQDVKAAWNNMFATARRNSVSALPAVLVNNSSNFLGFTHVLTEVMMFKASLKGGVLVEKATGPIDYTIQAFKRVYSESLQGSQIKSGGFFESIKGKPLRGTIDFITDTKAATEREVALQKGVARDAVKLGNPWQTRSTLAGLVVWTLSALIPDKKESDTEVENMVVLANTNKPAYVVERLRQAVWVPEWPAHKRQMIGLGIMFSGICSTFGAWRNHIKVPGVGSVYDLNKGYLATGLITLTSSLPLLFASDDQRGFGGFGSIMLGRLAFLPSSISKKIRGGEKGASWYIGATTSFQAENMAQALIGGAEKLPDGTIIDHNELREHAKKKAQEAKQEKAGHALMLEADSSAIPTNKIVSVASLQAAMPERAQASQQETASALV